MAAIASGFGLGIRPFRQAKLACASSVMALAFGTQAHAQTVPVQQPGEPISGRDAAQTQAQPQSQDDGIPDIIVTAQKRSESVNKVGMSITAVTGETLLKQGVSVPADLVRVIPGLNYTQSSYGAPVYTIRGIGYYDTSLSAAPAVSVYTDEVPLPYSILTTGAGLDVERVEVLKGPQGTLYGQNSTGGAINYIAAKPTKSLRYGLDATYQSFGEGLVQGFISGPLTDTLAVRVAARLDEGGTWQRSYTRSDELGRNDLLVGRVLLDWKPSDSLSVELNVNGWRDKSDNQASQYVGLSGLTAPAVILAYPLAPANARSADWDADKAFRRNDKFFQVSGRVNWDVSDTVKLTSITAYQHLSRESLIDADGTSYQNFAVGQPGHIGSFYQEVRARIGLGSRADLTMGGNFGHDKIYEELDILSSTAFSTFPYNYGQGFGNTTTERVAAFAALNYSVTDTLKIEGSIRYSHMHQTYSGCTRSYLGDSSLSNVIASVGNRLRGSVIAIPYGQCATLGAAPTFIPGLFTGEINESNVPWRVNLNWQATPTTLLYANVSRGYKEGGFPVAGATFASSLNPVEQEKVTAYEAGAKLGLFGRRLQVNGAFFYYDYYNKQLRGTALDPIIGRYSKLLNVPTSHVEGAEVDATVVPTRGLRFEGGATYVRSKVDGSFTTYDLANALVDISGESFPLTPRWQVNLDGEYEFDVAGNFEAFAGAHLNYQGATTSKFAANALLAVPSYTVVDARIGVRQASGPWSLTVFARNLTDRYYWNFVGFSSPNTAVRYAGRPRIFGVTLSYRP